MFHSYCDSLQAVKVIFVLLAESERMLQRIVDEPDSVWGESEGRGWQEEACGVRGQKRRLWTLQSHTELEKRD